MSNENEVLPTGNDVYSKAVKSVYCRGFHTVQPIGTTDWRIMAQFLRLVEELAEYMEATTWEPRGESTANEIADTFIVLSQLAWLTGMDPAELSAERKFSTQHVESEQETQNPLVCLGKLGRALRKFDDYQDSILHIQSSIRMLARQMHIRASKKGFNIEDVIARKCEQDEGRGFLHGKKHVGGMDSERIA